MARYECPICGFIYDEDEQGAPFDPDTYFCELCGASGTEFIKLEDAPAEQVPAATPASEPVDAVGSLDYPRDTARSDDSIRHMSTIHQMALTGTTITEAMATKLPLPSWDDILVLGAQLNPLPLPDDASVDCSVVIGPSAEKPLKLDYPVYISHMSFGALSKETKTALAQGTAAAHCAMCSGEGGQLPEERAAAYQYIFEYVPNKYSATDENLRNADAIEIKIGQGTKPGKGGELPGSKVTSEIAALRGVPEGTTVHSPSCFPGIESKEDLKNLVDDLRQRSAGRPIGVKIAAGRIEADLEWVVYSGADFVTLDGRGGATGASPMVLRDASSIPTIYALSRARAYLDSVSSDMSLIITGGLRVSSDFVKALALGADAVAIASAALIAAGCQQYRICGSGRCPVGIATQDESLRARLDAPAAAQRVGNFLSASCAELEMFGRITGHETLSALSVDDLATTSKEIADHTAVPFV